MSHVCLACFDHYAIIIDISDTMVSLHSVAKISTPTPSSFNFWEVLRSFPHKSLWQYFRCDGDGSWIHWGLLLGSLVVVHDGS